jgi:tetratricopeptide (TPR) repeat protein
MRRYSMFPFRGSWVLLTIIISLFALNACSEWRSIERENKQTKKKLLNKIENNEKLSYDEINNLSGILLWDEDYDEGIRILELLKNNDMYDNEIYLIDYTLSLFYTEKYKAHRDKASIEHAKKYLAKGFKESPEEPMAYYNRSKVYAVMGCKEKALDDLARAINTASSREIILFEDGVYLEKNKFIEFMNKELDRIQTMRESCILR